MIKEFWKVAGIRALRIVCKTAVTAIGTSAMLSEVNRLHAASTSALAVIIPVMT